MSAYATRITTILASHLDIFSGTYKLGRAASEMLFGLEPDGSLRRRPDVAFVSYQRWAKSRPVPPTAAWEIVPDLAVEVVSPSNFAEEIVVKAQEYFRFGVQVVWFIYPVVRQVYVYESPTQIRVLQAGEELDGGKVVPGFRLPLTTLFDDETAP
jgi:Uma2 family endonuclease